MCGLNLVTCDNVDLLKIMMKNTESRGRDDANIFSDNNLSMGHNLLSIQSDKFQGSQPYHTENFVFIYNGEIYNKDSIYEDIPESKFVLTNSDTELLAIGLSIFGLDFLTKIDGMYSIIIYDKINKKIYLCRDLSGMKPLYYSVDNNILYASSSIKSIRKAQGNNTICKKGVSSYLNLGYFCGSDTVINNIKKVKPGQTVSFDVESNRLEYFTDDLRIRNTKYNNEEILNNCRNNILKSRPSIPYGLLLSGGLDSSVIAYELSKADCLNTFTTRFSDDDVDANHAESFAKTINSNHQEVKITLENYISNYKKCILKMDQPYANDSLPAYFLAYEAISNKKLRVAINGDGGDEIFAGYDRYNHEKNINDVLRQESLTHLPENYLIRNDNISMSYTIESRSPLTNRLFKEFILGIDGNIKLQKGLKTIIKDCYKNKLPEYLLKTKKTGWTIPHKWMHSNEFVDSISKIINTDKIYKLLKLKTNTKELIKMINLSMWCNLNEVKYE